MAADMHDAYINNDNLRKRLTQNWDSMPEHEKISLRAYRSKRGVKCDKCGCIGFYRENCPNKCDSTVESFPVPAIPVSSIRPKIVPIQNSNVSSSQCEWSNSSTPSIIESDDDSSVQDSTAQFDEQPSQIYLWTIPSPITRQHSSSQLVTTKTDKLISSEPKASRQAAFTTPSTISKDRNLDTKYMCGVDFADSVIQNFQKNRTMSELSLHQVLMRLVHVLEAELAANQTKLRSAVASGLLKPPEKIEGEAYYPSVVGGLTAYRDYFVQEKETKDRQYKSHQYLGQIQTDDVMSSFLRGDPEVTLRTLYMPSKQAGASIHSKSGWKSITAKHDQLAESDINIVKQQIEVKKQVDKQNAWAGQQREHMENSNRRYLHLLHILNEEISAEHAREMRILEGPHAELGKVQAAVWKERIAAANRIMKTLLAYNVIGQSDEAAFLLFELKHWRRDVKKSKRTSNDGGGGGGFTKKGSRRGVVDKSLNKRRHGKNKNINEKSTNLSGSEQSSISVVSDGFDVGSIPDDLSSGASVSVITDGGPSVTEGVKVTPYFRESNMIHTHTVGGKNVLFAGVSGERRRGHERTLSVAAKDRQIRCREERKFRFAGLDDHVRKGVTADVTQQPSLIPVQDVFRDTISCNSLQATRTSESLYAQQFDPVSGHKAMHLAPLYVSLTTIERNGSTATGTLHQLKLSKDRRYSHFIGRALSCMEK